MIILYNYLHYQYNLILYSSYKYIYIKYQTNKTIKFLKFDLNYSQLLPTNNKLIRFAILKILFYLYVSSPQKKNITTITNYVKVHVIRTNKFTQIYDFIDQETTHKQQNLNRFAPKNISFKNSTISPYSLKSYMIYLSNQRKQ
ncbi:unnamed protein product [Paramecium primaurelia]|uniref:Uncharacterized protein n=1 Tax=Paramecium primaurelia TaxID=5886 RepID=A0A8S1LYZ0_PARPR|nr:unnamed protein product [Paramecium primaurelia]